MLAMDENQILEEQVAYYRARAAEYDEWFLREGRYDRGPEHRAEWFREVAEVESDLAAEQPRGEVLELACGTGLRTRHLVQTADHVAAVDASPEVIALNRARVGSNRVEHVVADLFAWSPPMTYDFIFFGFWLSHLPRSRFDSFWTLVRQALRPSGEAFFMDSLLQQTSTARDHAPIDQTTLERDLQSRGWQGYVRATAKFFLYGCMSREDEKLNSN
jgi:SAM-dependent methyltransferase